MRDMVLGAEQGADENPLVEHTNERVDLDPRYEGIIDGAGLKKTRPRAR